MELSLKHKPEWAKTNQPRAGEMTHQLRLLTTLAEDSGSFPI